MLFPFYTALGLCTHATVRIRRTHWHDDSFVVYMSRLVLPPFNTQDTSRKVNDRTAAWIGEDTALDSQPYLAHFDGASKLWQPGWNPSTSDLFATNWEVPEQEHDRLLSFLPKASAIRVDEHYDMCGRNHVLAFSMTVGWEVSGSLSVDRSVDIDLRGRIEEPVAEFITDPFGTLAKNTEKT